MAAVPKLVAVTDEATAIAAVNQIIVMDVRNPQQLLSKEEESHVIVKYLEGAFDAHICFSQISQARIETIRKASLKSGKMLEDHIKHLL